MKGQPASVLDVFRGMRSDYAAAKPSRFRSKLTGVHPLGSGESYHWRNELDFYRAMEQARDFDRNNPVVGQGVTRLVRNVLQTGPVIDPNSGNAELNERLREKWWAWSEDESQCDAAQEHCFQLLAEKALRHAIVDGDCFALPLRDGSIEFIEGHRCKTPTNTTQNVVLGVKVDERWRRQQYWFTKEDVSPFATIKRVGDMRQIDARNGQGRKQVFHLYDPKRLSAVRGVSALLPPANMLGQLDDLMFAKLVQAQVASVIAFIRKRELVGGEGGSYADGGLDAGNSMAAEIDRDTARMIEGLGPGVWLDAAPGESIEGFSPNTPNESYFNHSTQILTIIAANLDLPLAVLFLDPSKTNFSGWRGAMDQARVSFRGIQEWMLARFYRPVYEWKVRQWIAQDPVLAMLAREAANPFGHEWKMPSWAYIEPMKDAQADALQIHEHLNSRRGVLSRRGLDIEMVDREIVQDNARLIGSAIEAAAALRERYGVEVHWRDVLHVQGRMELVDSVDEVDGPGGADGRVLNER